MKTDAPQDRTLRPAERQPGSRQSGSGQKAGHAMQMGSYGRFAAMVAVSTSVGWAAMYLNVYQLDHVFFSWMRLFMAMIMGGVMTAIMMLFMWRMYPSKKANLAVLGVAAALFLAGLGLARTQATVDDVAWMKAMIPHHSIALLTSERARIENPRVRALVDGIIESQRREIAEMKALIEEIEKGSQ
jgi:uncharacterized protein (DUF305 family)